MQPRNPVARLTPAFIAACRVIIGGLWLFSLRWKLPPDFAPSAGKGLLDWLQLEVQYAAFPFYGNFVQSVVIPNFAIFAWLIFLAELGVGLALVTGLFVRTASLLGALMAGNLLIGLLAVPGEWPWSYIMLGMWHTLFFVANAGLVFGLDALRVRRGRRWLQRGADLL